MQSQKFATCKESGWNLYMFLGRVKRLDMSACTILALLNLRIEIPFLESHKTLDNSFV